MHSHVFRISEIGFVPWQLWRLFPSLPCFLLWDAIRKSEQNYKHRESPDSAPHLLSFLFRWKACFRSPP